MNVKEITMGIVATIVALVIVVVCAIPIISDSVKTEDTFENVGYFHMQKYDTSTDVTVSWDHTNPKVITVNGSDYSMANILPYNQWTSVLIADNWYLRYADGVNTQFVQVTYGGIANIPGASNSATDFEIICSNGTATINAIGTGGTQTKTVTYTDLYVISDADAPYVMKKSDATAYMNEDSPFVGLGTTAVATSESVLCRIDGTIKDGADVTVVASTNDDVTLVADSIEINSTELSNGHIGYQLSTIQFDVTKTDSDPVEITYSYFVVPATVDLEKSIHADGPTIDILSVIPVMMVLAILIGAVGMFIKTRRD